MRLAIEVPAPPGEELPPGLSDVEIDLFTQRTALPAPTELQESLPVTHHARIRPGDIYGIRPLRKTLDIEAVFESLPEFKHNGWLPISTEGRGNYYVLALSSESEPLRPAYF